MREIPRNGESALLGLEPGLRLDLADHCLALPQPQHLRRLALPDAPQPLQLAGRGLSQVDLALGPLPVHDRGDAHAHQLAELGLREPQALAQGLHSLAGDPEAAFGGRLGLDGRAGAGNRPAQGEQLLLHGIDLAAQAGDQGAVRGHQAPCRNHLTLNYFPGQADDLGLQFFHQVGHLSDFHCLLMWLLLLSIIASRQADAGTENARRDLVGDVEDDACACARAADTIRQPRLRLDSQIWTPEDFV